MLQQYIIHSSGSKVLEEYVDFRYEFVDGNEMEIKTTGSSLNTSTKTLILASTSKLKILQIIMWNIGMA